MRFEHQTLFWLALAATIGLVAFSWWAWRTKQRLLKNFVGAKLLGNLTAGISPSRQKARMALVVAALTFLLLALARPQWGFDWEEARQRGLDVVVAIDTSRSMIAADIPPNRLARAKLAALDLKRLARADRVGLVAFAGSAFLQCPLSFDDEAFRQSVNALDVNIIPVGGSAIAEAIETARAAFKEKNDNHKVLVLFTDGEDNDGRAVEAAEAAAKDGMRIFTIGVGTANGELLRLTDGKGRTDYVRDDQGNVIKSRLNEKLLQDISRATQGFYMLLSGANTIELLYERGLAPLPKTEHTSRRLKRFHERYQWLLALAIVLLCVEMLLPERRRARRTAAATPSPIPAKAAALLIAFLAPCVAFGSVNSAQKDYKAGKFESALREYERLLREKPLDARLHYNAGTAAFQAKDYERAQQHFSAASGGQDTNLQQRALYNLGNTQFRAGEADANISERLKVWEQALKSYEASVELNEKDQDAIYNRDLVRKKIEECKQEQKQQNDKSGDKDDEQKKKDEQKDQDKKDQQQKDQQQQEQGKDQQKQEQRKPEDQQSPQPQEQKQGDKEEQKQPDQKPGEEQNKKPESQQQQQQQKPGDKTEKGEHGQEGNGQVGQQRLIPMTQEQAQRLLEAAKNEERVMIFTPQGRTNRNNRVLKDW
jgi:Ca-activated chloride channel family protein